MRKQKNIYLDVSVLCRPFDDQSYARIKMETIAWEIILENIKEKKYICIFSPVHYAEIEAMDQISEKIELLTFIKAMDKQYSFKRNEVKIRAEELVADSFGPADAAHVAFAEASSSIFVSCDDKLLKKCQKKITEIICVNPVTFCEMESL